MSGIAGLVRFDGHPIERSDLDRMANALRPYGPDRSDIVKAGHACLVHVLMRITPEDMFDRQPWQGASGALITADVRLDNRDDLLDRIGVARLDAAGWPDSRVLLAAWEKYRDDIWPTLRGPFAVAIWEPGNRRLTLARDHLGLNVVMWHRGKGFFAFATMPKGLFALTDVPRELSEEKLADFLVLNHAEHETTFFRNIFRLPPAHVATVDAAGAMNMRRYWSVSDIRPVRLASDEAYAQGMRERLDQAVRRQMRSASPIGCYLSGGLDSSSVAALAARALAEKGQRLAAFTHVPRKGFDGPVPGACYADETPYVEAIRSMAGNIDVTYLYNDEHDDFSELERMFLAMDAPVRNPTNLGWMFAIERLARTQNRRVLLGGFWGNFTISWDGRSQVVNHLRRGRLLTAFRQLRQIYRASNYSRWGVIEKLVAHPLIPLATAVWADRLLGRVKWRNHAPIRNEFAADMRIEKRACRVGHDFHYRMRADERAAGLTMADYAGDWNAAAKSIHGVEVRDPTADLDVVEYCFGIPPEQYLVEGVERSLVRRAMWGLLPPVVLTNPLQGLQSPDWYEKLALRRGALLAELDALKASPLARRAVDLERLERALQNWPQEGWQDNRVIAEYHFALSRGLAVGRFARWAEAANR